MANPFQILIVDDEKNIRRTLEMVLSGEGYECAQAEHLAEAIYQLEQKQFDAIFDAPLTTERALEAEDLAKEGDALSTATNVLLYAGGAITLTGATLLVIGYLESSGSESDPTDSPETTVDVSLTPESGHIFIKRSF